MKDLINLLTNSLLKDKEIVSLTPTNEIEILPPGKVTLSQLENLQSRIKASKDPKEKISLAIQCAEKVLFIFEEKYPEDKRPRKAIEAAKKYLADPTGENEATAADAADAANDAAFYADDDANDAAFYAATAATVYAAFYGAVAAIKAFKIYNHIPLEEIRINQPQNHNKIWQDCFDNAKREAKYQQEIYGEYIDIEEVYQAANECFKEKTGLDIDTLELDEMEILPPNKKGSIPSKYYIPEISDLIKSALPIMKHNNYDYISFIYGLNWVSSYRKKDNNNLAQYSLIDRDLQQFLYEIGYHLHKLDPSIDKFILDKYGKVWTGDKYNQVIYEKIPINEIEILPPAGKKLKAFQTPSGAICLIFKGTPKNSTLKKYVKKIGWLNKKTNQVKFESAEHTIDEFKNVLNRLNISFNILSEDGLVIGIDFKYFNIKPIDNWIMYDEDVEKENWFTNISINEIEVFQPGFNFNNLKTVVGEAKIHTDFFSAGYYIELVDLGTYYTFLPYGDQPHVILISKKYVKLTDKTGDFKELRQEEMNQIKDLISQNKIYKATPVNLNEIEIRLPRKHWNLTKHISNFDPTDIRVGDKITINPKRKYSSFSNTEMFSFTVDNIERVDENGFLDPNGEVYYFNFKKENSPETYSYSSNQLIWFNQNNLNEIEIIVPGDKKYNLNPEFEEWIDSDWEDIRYNFEEDTADAVWMFNMASPDNKTLRKSDVNTFLKKHKDMWDGDTDSLIEFLLDYRVIIPLDSQITENKISKPTNLKDAIKSLTEYMVSQGMNIEPLPKLIMVDDDSENVNDILGKTAYYNPGDCSITLYTLNRHPKDVLRSYAHEIVHRMQDNEGRLNNVNTTNTNEGGELLDLEKEAYEKGNIMLRNWEDLIKNQ